VSYLGPLMQGEEAVMRRSRVGVAEDAGELPEPVLRDDALAGLTLRQRAGSEAKRVRRGLRRPANWFQLVRFSMVGGTGYVINLTVYTLLVAVAGIHYIPAAVLAFCVAVTNNFLLNRQWTFQATDGRASFQAPRFLIVSLIALGFNLIVLEVLVGILGVDKVIGQATAVLAATPLNFIGNKLWSFRGLGHSPGLRTRR
jgi:putative flippase GtrA